MWPPATPPRRKAKGGPGRVCLLLPHPSAMLSVDYQIVFALPAKLTEASHKWSDVLLG